MNILLVEPDIVLARTYVTALKREGHKVVCVNSAQAAVHEADKHAPDIVILELQLPRHNGVEFLYEFRSYGEWLRIPIMLHTFVPPHELAQADILTRELGVVRTLYKPDTTLAQLCSAVQTAAAVEA